MFLSLYTEHNVVNRDYCSKRVTILNAIKNTFTEVINYNSH